MPQTINEKMKTPKSLVGSLKILKNDEHSIVSPLVAVSLRMYKMTLARIPTTGLDIRYENKTAYLLYESATPKQLKYWWSFGTLLTSAVALICMCAAIIKKFFYPTQVLMDILEGGNLVFFSLVTAITLANTHTIFKHKDRIAQWKILLANQFELRCVRTSNEVLPGLLLTYYVLGIVVFVPLWPIVFHLIGFNPFVTVTRVLYSESWFPIPDFKHICTIHPVAMVPLLLVMSVGLCMASKFLYIVLALWILFAIGIKVYLHTLTKFSSEYLQLRYYNQLIVFGTFQRYLLSEMAMNLVCWSQMFLSCLAWFSITQFHVLPSFLYMTTSAAFIGGLAIAVFLIDLQASLRLFSMVLIEKKRKRYYAVNRGRCGRNHFYYSKAWRAQQPFPMYFGQRFPFSKAAALTFLDVLSSNVTNACLLI